MPWYRIRCDDDGHRASIQKALKNQNFAVWRYGSARQKYLVTLVGNDHEKWLRRMCADYGARNVAVIGEPPKEIQISGRAQKAQESLARRRVIAVQVQPDTEASGPERPTSGPPFPADAVAPAAESGAAPPSPDGLLADLEAYRDQLWLKLEALDTLLGHFKSWQADKARLDDLLKNYRARINSLRQMLEKEDGCDRGRLVP